ncbi:conserved hypothetical protein [Arthrobacter sp. 9AX]|uniref:LamG-like jellyroll fold domain-containing protein n=1 Tax=Arthrobacter sp. 9AX TaxID=2653131 RepID=UPI0012F0C90E|nr:LamG-like jellyroll fold domain-containing protein [Arthrobacter sp. 9AX]VXB78459.1 conserved hypothetical protein [Arthrobacter sp. 9AX]
MVGSGKGWTTAAAPLAVVVLAVLCGCASLWPTRAGEGDAYDAAVLADGPVAYWVMANGRGGTEPDITGSGHDGRYSGSARETGELPNGSAAATFGGEEYLEVPDAADLRPATTGVLTVEAWIRPDTLAFRDREATGYVHWLGKADNEQYEYVARMYSAGNREDRENRISGYHFNLPGGLGAGSYFQDPVSPGEWIHYVLVINRTATSDEFPNGYTKIFKDGVLRDQDDLSVDGDPIAPGPGHAPLRIGTSDFESFFEGAVGKVAIYGHELSPAQVLRHYQLMTGNEATPEAGG